jgi:CheY-like chemotaxis protein
MASILVVEDFEDSRYSLCRLLEMSGHRVLEARTGREAVEGTLRQRPDLVLMDLSLPDIDGVEATEMIRAGEGERRTPIVVLSAHDADMYRERAFAAGCDGYVTKPVDFDELERVIAGFVA